MKENIILGKSVLSISLKASQTAQTVYLQLPLKSPLEKDFLVVLSCGTRLWPGPWNSAAGVQNTDIWSGCTDIGICRKLCLKLRLSQVILSMAFSKFMNQKGKKKLKKKKKHFTALYWILTKKLIKTSMPFKKGPLSLCFLYSDPHPT